MKLLTQLVLAVCVALGLYLSPSYAANLNGPHKGNFFAATGENFKVTGVQVTETGCEKTSVTISGQITGTTDDGDGYDEVSFQLWDDYQLKDSKDLKVKVGETMNFKVTLSFESLYGTSVAGVGVYVYDMPDEVEIYSNDPFIPEDITGSCLGTYTLSVSLVGTGKGEVKSTPEGIDCGDDCSENFEEGTEVTLRAIPQPGSVFKGWKGSSCDGVTSDTCVVIMTSAQDITAVFDEESSCSGSYDKGFEAGKRWCREHPEECGISTGGGSGECDCVASFDFITNTLHIPNFQNTYELDFTLVGTDPVTLQLKSYKPLH